MRIVYAWHTYIHIENEEMEARKDWRDWRAPEGTWMAWEKGAREGERTVCWSRASRQFVTCTDAGRARGCSFDGLRLITPVVNAWAWCPHMLRCRVTLHPRTPHLCTYVVAAPTTGILGYGLSASSASIHPPPPPPPPPPHWPYV